METTNLPGHQNIQVNCQNITSNTTPTSCSSWSSNEYTDTFPQGNSLGPFYPGTPCPRISPDNREDKFALQHPFFAGPPFLQPFFNSAIAPDFYFAHNLGMSSHHALNNNIVEAPKQDKNGYENHNKFSGSFADPGNFQRFGKMDQKTGDPRNIQKCGRDQENVNQFPEHHCRVQSPVECQRNPSFIQCACNNAIPWTCNPFIVPMISYYVLWNSWRANTLPLPAHLSWNHVDGSFRKETKEPIHHEDVNSSFKKRNNTVDSISNTSQTYEQMKDDNSWVPKQSKNNLVNVLTETSFISLSISSLNCTEENVFCNAENNNDISVLMKNMSKESDLQSRVSDKIEEESADNRNEAQGNNDSGDRLETEIHTLKIESNFISDSQTSVFNANQQGDSKITKDQPKVKVPMNCASDGSVSSSTLQTQFKDTLLGRKNSLIFFKKSKESLVQEALVHEENISQADNVNLNDKSKKSIKNFTLTEQNDGEAHEQSSPKALAAAAGDLGKETWAGYRLDIPSIQSDSNTKSKKGQNKVNSESSGSAKPGLIPKNKKKVLEKNVETQNKMEKAVVDKSKTAKNPQEVKSGIAKVNTFKEPRTRAPTKSVQEFKKLKDKEPIHIRHKHNCLGVATKTEVTENNPTKQKNKTFLALKEPAKGSDKQSTRSKTFNLKVGSSKTEANEKKLEQESPRT